MAPIQDISVILPCFNEEGNVQPLARELIDVLDAIGRPYEILFVDDGSTNGTVDRLHEIEQNHAHVRVLRHTVNAGQSAALLTGFRHARGRILITMDSDLQNDPADIPPMLARLESCDVVCGVRQHRQDTWLKRASSRVANCVRRAMLHDSIHDAGCAYRAFRRELAEIEILPFKGLHRFLPTIWKLHGFRVEEIAVNHRPRLAGRSKYGTWDRLGVGIYDILALRWYRRRHIPIDRAFNPDADEPAPRSRSASL